MKHYTAILAIGIICLCHLVVAAVTIEDKESSILEVYYQKIVEKDTTRLHTNTTINEMTLRAGPTSSMFYSTKKLWADSLRTFDFNTSMQITTARRESGDPTWWKPLGGDEWEYIFKNVPDGKVTATCLFDQEQRFYEEEWEKPQWVILDSIKTIIGFDCIKAETNYRGRKWIAWFAPDIAIQEGPWKLCGLPGLILEASDSKKHYKFIATGIAYTNSRNVGRYFFCSLPPTRMSRDQYFQKRHRYNNKTVDDIFNQAIQLAELNGSAPPRNINELNIDTTIVLRFDFEEVNYPH